jgi:hypothetical protein
MAHSLVALFLLTLAVAQKDNGEECSCFLTNDTSSGYFTYHRFHDFRNVLTDSDSVPGIDTNVNTASSAAFSSDFFSGNAWNADWAIQTWNNSDSSGTLQNDATVLQVNSPDNIYIGIYPYSHHQSQYLTSGRAKHR